MKKITKVFAVLTCAALAFSFWSCDNGNKVETYTVTYEDGVDDAEIAVPSDSTKYKTGDTVTVKFEGIGSRDGYTFAGWKDATTTYTESGTSTFKMKAADVTLTAQWTQNTATPSGDDDATSTTPSDNSTTTPSTPADPSTPTATLTANTSLQALITSATAGGNVELTGTSGAGTYISIDKALTVDGKNIEGLTVYVLPSVSSKVTLKNFKKASVKVGSPASAAKSARWARGAEEAGKEDPLPPPLDPPLPPLDSAGEPGVSEEQLKKIGDDALPIQIEGCTIESFESEKEIALYLESGDKKSEIDELKLKEDFTFIEMDNEDTKSEEKSKVGDLVIEDGVEKVSLIGGTFDDVSLADDFSAKVDFKYDKEFDDQFGEDFDKDAFFAESNIEAKDVAIVDNNETSLSGVWKMEINKEDLEYLNGYVSIVFLNEKQIKILTRQAPYDDESIPMVTYNYEMFNAENPVYCLTSVGDFKYDTESKEALRSLYGSDATIQTVSGYDEYGQPIFEETRFKQYPNYRKESVIVKVTEDKVIYYVNLDEIKKSDLLIGAISETGPIGAPGSKLSSVDLAGYKPYFAFDFGKFGDVWNSSQAVAVDQTEAPVDAQAMNGYENWADGVKQLDNGEWAPFGNGVLKNHITTEALASSKAMAMDGTPLYIPVYDTVQFEHGMPRFFFFAMDDASEEKFPDVSNVELTLKDVEEN